MYTYISTMGEVMISCIENGKEIARARSSESMEIILMNPMREEKYQSYVAYFPIPIVYGLTKENLHLWLMGNTG
ncbi:MAG: DUF1343 domain-containing protein [Saprospiraceae bacterium]